jgi:hypothetical protein
MDLNAYLLDGVVDATTPPNESEAAAQRRREAIGEMFRAFNPGDGMEAMIACHCITLQFLLNAAMRDAANVNMEAKSLARARAGAMSVSRTLHQWVTKFERVKKRSDARVAEMLEVVARDSAGDGAAEVGVTPLRPVEKNVVHPPTGDGRAGVSVPVPPNIPAIAAGGSAFRERRMTL